MKIKSKLLYSKHIYIFNFNIKTFWLRRFRKIRKRRTFFRIKAVRCRWRNIPIISYPPKSRRYWKFPGIRKKQRYRRFWRYVFRKYKRYPWLTGIVQQKSLYKLNYKKQIFVHKFPLNKTKNKFYKNEFQQYTAPKSKVFWWKHTFKKRAIQIRPIVRYYVYSPYLKHISAKNLIKNTKILKKIKNPFVENMQIKTIEWKLKYFLTRINFSVNKTNSKFLKEINAVALHNSKKIILKKKKRCFPVYFELFNKAFDWKNDYFFNLTLPTVSKKKLLNKNESISINKNYYKLNWTFFINLQKKKYLPHYCNINNTKNIIFLNRRFYYRNMLKNERLCKKFWTPITLLKNKIKYYFI